MPRSVRSKPSAKKPGRREVPETDLLFRYQSLDRISKVLAQTRDIEELIRNAINVTLSIFECDRTWLLFPCAVDQKTWRIPFEATHPKYPGALASGTDYPVDETVRQMFHRALNSKAPIFYGPGGLRHPWKGTSNFDIRSELHMAIRPKIGAPWLFGLHQCSYDRTFTAGEISLFVEISYRLEEALTTVLLYQSERQARKEAEAANKAKDLLLANLSHELRTPLSSVLAWAQVLRNGKSKPDKAIAMIEKAARLQEVIVNDLLDLSRLVLGKLALEKQNVDLDRIVRGVADSARPSIAAKSLQLDVEIAPGTRHILADPARIQQVLWNLLNNAAKFTQAGGKITIRVSTGGDGTARVEVTDTGDGIAPEFMPLIFDRFTQADSSATRAHGGLGLGLAISRQLVELHGGIISAHSEGIGRGSSFKVSLPLAAS